jgi:hypothetical protein
MPKFQNYEHITKISFRLSDYLHSTVLVVPSIVTEVFKSQQPPISSISITIWSPLSVEYEHIQVFLQEANETAKATTAKVKTTFFIINFFFRCLSLLY